jgi:hypothetical protein
MFITVFTTARYLSLSWVRPVRAILPSYIVNIHFNIIVSHSRIRRYTNCRAEKVVKWPKYKRKKHHTEWF